MDNPVIYAESFIDILLVYMLHQIDKKINVFLKTLPLFY